MPIAPAPPKPTSKKDFVKHQEDEVRSKLASLPIKYKDSKTIATVRHFVEDRLREARSRYEHNGNSSQVMKAYYNLEEELKREIYKVAAGKTKNKDQKSEDIQAKRRGKFTTQTRENTNVAKPKETISRGGFGKSAASPPTGQPIKSKDQVAPLTSDQKAAQQVRNAEDIAKRVANRKTPPGRVISRGGDVGHGHVSRPARMSSKQVPTRPPNKPIQTPTRKKGVTIQSKKPLPKKRGPLKGSVPSTLPNLNQLAKNFAAAQAKQKTSVGNITSKIVIPPPGAPKPSITRPSTKIIIPSPGITTPKSPIINPSKPVVIPPSKVIPPEPSFPIMDQSVTIIPQETTVESTVSTPADRGLYTPDRRRDTDVTESRTTQGSIPQDNGGSSSPEGYAGGGGEGGEPPNKKKNKPDRNPLEEAGHLYRRYRGLALAARAASAAVSFFSTPAGWWTLGAIGLLLLIIIIIVAFAGGYDAAEKAKEKAKEQPKETLTIKKEKVGPPTAVNGEIITYTLTVTDTQPAQEITIVEHLPEGISLAVGPDGRPTDITSSWPKFAFDPVQKTVTWKASENAPPGSLNAPNFPITITMKVIANNVHLINWAEATPVRAGGAVNENWVPPAPPDSCGGKYSNIIANNTKLPMNYGDPQCSFDKDKLRELLVKLENNNQEFVNYWFVVIIPGESAFNPNAWAKPTGLQALLDDGGAWGLYQKGSSTPPGSPPPAEGKNGPLDRGDVNWEVQTANAVKANRDAGCTFWYYGTFRRSPEGGKGEVKRC